MATKISPDISDRVKKIIAEHLDIEKVETLTEDKKFGDDLGADSLDNAEMLMAFEEEFDIEIPDNMAERISTVGDTIKYITENT